MKTEIPLYALVIFIASVHLAAAQEPKKLYRIGYLSASDSATESIRSQPIRVALRELGYIDGQNLTVEYRYAEGKLDRLSELAAELVRLKVDVLLAAGGYPGILAAKNATKTIPIVILGLGVDPVEAGFIESIGRPGGNITGITNLTRELSGKRLELLKEAVPKLARVAVLYNPGSQFDALDVKEVLPVASRALKLTIEPREVRTTDDFDRVFVTLNKQRPDGLYLATSPLIFSNGNRIAALALKSRLPA